MPPSFSGKVLNNKWKLGSLIGRGGCAEVYEVTDVRSQVGGGEAPPRYVAKIAPLPSGLPPAMKKGKKRKKTDQEKHADMIYYEYTLYKGFLLGHDGVVQIPPGGYGEDQNVRYLVMTRLGPEIEAAQTKSGPWSAARIAGYARKMLNLLQSLHEKSKMVFVDVKPENFMFGYPGSPDEDKIFLIDFGLSFRYTGREGAIKPQSFSAQVQGTPEFLSLKCHGGASPGRCDDLESLGYVILSLLRQDSSSPLPWSGAKSVADGLAKKRKTSLETLCQGCPAPMLDYMRAVRAMEYEDTPDYSSLDAMLAAMQDAGEERGSGSVRRGATVAKRGTRQIVKISENENGDGDDEDEKVGNEVVGSRKMRGGASSAAAQAVSSEHPQRRRSSRFSMSSEKKADDSRTTMLSPSGKAEEKAGRSRSRGGRSTRSRKHEQADSASDVDDEGVFEDEDGDEEVMEVKVVAGAAGKGGGVRKSGRAAAAEVIRAGERGRGSKRGSRRASTPTEFVLEVCGGPHEGKIIRVTSGGAEVRVGRSVSKANGLRLDKDMEVSSKHGILRPETDGIRYEDRGSLNGSFVNEERLEGVCVLKDGDVLQVGQSAVRVTTSK